MIIVPSFLWWNQNLGITFENEIFKLTIFHFFDFIDFIQGAELLIHNAPFDVSFINQEFSLAGFNKTIEDLLSLIHI